MTELVNVASGISGFTVQARDIEGGVHFHFTVPDRDGVVRCGELSEAAAAALEIALHDLEARLDSLGVADPRENAEEITRSVLLAFREDRNSHLPVLSEPRLATLVGDITAFAEPARLLAQRFYFSTRKVATLHRAYRHLLPDIEEPEQRFLALHRLFCSREQVLFQPADLPGDDQWAYFTADFILAPDEVALDRVPQARGVLTGPRGADTFHMVSRIFGEVDPFFYPFVQFRGQVSGRDAVLLCSRKHIPLNSSTVSTLADAMRGSPLRLRGFGSVGHTADDVVEIQPIVLRTGSATS
ncbi:hypothetical protein [Amycolatopsis alba]|uniref:Uncharacterized protein n=1 Tax=Amycolatopsis alba DSM 44262 TaxID=1125972 RepID=A0A229RUR1_AMYAL|nr:hypothetical protein [Amycolatopsis alba]OXM50418.1 hypothetical protein CFP75_16110 [Amycolatopsis alba DSM 44262]